jgi:hypothetical protein
MHIPLARPVAQAATHLSPCFLPAFLACRFNALALVPFRRRAGALNTAAGTCERKLIISDVREASPADVALLYAKVRAAAPHALRQASGTPERTAPKLPGAAADVARSGRKLFYERLGDVTRHLAVAYLLFLGILR